MDDTMSLNYTIWRTLADWVTQDECAQYNYSFSPNHEWVRTEEYFAEMDAGEVESRKRTCMKVIALDCEMCGCLGRCPIKGGDEKNVLIRLSVVGLSDLEDESKSTLLLDLLINPTEQITDMRTRLHNIR